MAKYLQIIPATDWFFAFNRGTASVTVFHVAAWALTEGGNVIGLIGSVNGDRLVEPPGARDGMYLHRDQLSPDQLGAASRV